MKKILLRMFASTAALAAFCFAGCGKDERRSNRYKPRRLRYGMRTEPIKPFPVLRTIGADLPKLQLPLPEAK